MIILRTMKKRQRKHTARIIVCAFVVMMFTAGCGQSEEKPVPVDLSSEYTQDRNEDQAQDTGEDEEARNQTEDTAKDEEARNQTEDTAEDEEAKEGQQSQASGNEELEGSVRSVGQNSFVISKITTYSEGDAEFAIEAAPGAADEELITVYVNENCTYQYKSVRNSGINPEDVSEREGSFADMKEGLTVDMQGSWKDGSFYADSMIMWEFT